MEYSSKQMTIKELCKENGYREHELLKIAHMPRQKIARKAGIYRNSVLIFDTEELEKYRKTLFTGR